MRAEYCVLEWVLQIDVGSSAYSPTFEANGVLEQEHAPTFEDVT